MSSVLRYIHLLGEMKHRLPILVAVGKWVLLLCTPVPEHMARKLDFM